MINAIEVNNLNVKFEENVILENVSISIPEGEFLGIIGPNGAGKTTFFKAILGLVKPTSGAIKIFDKPANENRHLVGYVPQYSMFDGDYPISVFDVVLSGVLKKDKLFRRYSKSDKELALNALEVTGMTDFKNRLAGELSGGEKQRVLISRALVKNPKILLLDEPTASIDAPSGMNFYSVLQNLSNKMTIILVSHDIGAVSQNVKKIACLNKTLVFHDSAELTVDMVESAYQCPVDLIAHGHPHRVLHKH